MPPKRPLPHLPKRTSRKWRKPDLTVPQILEWVDEFCRLTGRFPNKCSGKIPLTGETWCAIDQALSGGGRGLSGGRSLAKLLSLRRDYRNRSDLPKLTERQIVRWAKAHFQETGQWPEVNSGEIAGHAGERWSAVNAALRFGRRGLPGQSSLSLLLAAEGLKRQRTSEILACKCDGTSLIRREAISAAQSDNFIASLTVSTCGNAEFEPLQREQPNAVGSGASPCYGSCRHLNPLVRRAHWGDASTLVVFRLQYGSTGWARGACLSSFCTIFRHQWIATIDSLATDRLD